MWIIKCDVGYFREPGNGCTIHIDSAHNYLFEDLHTVIEDDCSSIKLGSNRYMSEMKVRQEFISVSDSEDLWF
ncbi:hypothetical protein [Vibrio phage vB_VpaP_SJSY21]|nr:hypothetical protein [Vibrio phage vB_VpaP_SJSY21]